jgi:serine/threonine protein kinase
MDITQFRHDDVKDEEVLSSTMDHTHFRHDNVKDEEVLRDGTFGVVEKAHWGNSTVAIKYLYDSSKMHTELSKLKRVYGAKHIVGYYGLIVNGRDQTGIVMEYCARGTLRNYLTSDFRKFRWHFKFIMAREIAKGLRFIHQQGLLHRNLHDDNILIDDRRRALIADFGLARSVERTAFIPPEELRDRRKDCTTRGDIYSLGGILWELSAGRQPFYERTKGAITEAVLEGQRETPVDNTPRWYQGLYTECWAAEPMERPTIDHIVQCLTTKGRYLLLCGWILT